MIRTSDIQEKLLHLIGWRQNYDTSDFRISDDLTISESGLYFQQVHPLLTLQNMSSIAPDFKNITFPEWVAEKQYNKGDIISADNTFYRAVQPVKGVRPINKNLLINGSFEVYKDNSQSSSSNTVPYDWQIYNMAGVIISDNSHDGHHSLFTKFSGAPKRYSQYVFLKNNTKYKISLYIKTPSGYNAGYIKLGFSNSDYGTIIYSEKFYSTNKWSKVEFVFEIPDTFQIPEGHINILFSDEFKADENRAMLIDDASLTYYEDKLASDYWEEVDLFSDWLKEKTVASINKAIVRFCNEKIAEQTGKALCENRTLFDGTGRLVDTVKNKNNLVGFEIIPIRAKGVTTKINKIGLQFTKAGDYTLYLMHSSMSRPVKTIKLTKLHDKSTEWFSIDDLYLPYQGEETDAGGSWYLCYSQSELPFGSYAIRKDKDWSKEPCKACSHSELIAWKAWSKYLEIHPFLTNEELVDMSGGIHLWDVEKNQYTYDNNYGLNLEVTVSCDFTDFILEQKMMFVDIIAKQVAVDMLREFAYNANVRTNRHSVNASRLDILYEIDGDSASMKKSGLNYQLDMAFKAIKLSTEGIDRICMPCKNNGIKYRTI